MTYQLTQFDFDTLMKPWWLEVSVNDPGIFTVTNIVSEESKLYEISEVHEDIETLQDGILKSIRNFTETHIPPRPGKLDMLEFFSDTHLGVSLSFHKKTGQFFTAHEETGMMLKYYSLADLFILGPKIIENDGELHEMMVQQGML